MNARRYHPAGQPPECSKVIFRLERITVDIGPVVRGPFDEPAGYEGNVAGQLTLQGVDVLMSQRTETPVVPDEDGVSRAAVLRRKDSTVRSP